MTVKPRSDQRHEQITSPDQAGIRADPQNHGLRRPSQELCSAGIGHELEGARFHFYLREKEALTTAVMVFSSADVSLTPSQLV